MEQLVSVIGNKSFNINFDVIEYHITNVIDVVKNANLFDLNCCGVYILIFTNEEKYIGSSNDICQRILNHNNSKRFKNKIIAADVYITPNIYFARMLELILIRDMKPELNIRLS